MKPNVYTQHPQSQSYGGESVYGARGKPECIIPLEMCDTPEMPETDRAVL